MMSSNIDTRTIIAFFAIFGLPLKKVACAKLKKIQIEETSTDRK